MDNVGKIITPVLILALAVLGGSALAARRHAVGQPARCQSSSLALGQGFLQGYQTMDALASLIFGIVIVNAIKAAA
jgi:LIVCS family branched-chain amino acid:cation transporter